MSWLHSSSTVYPIKGPSRRRWKQPASRNRLALLPQFSLLSIVVVNCRYHSKSFVDKGCDEGVVYRIIIVISVFLKKKIVSVVSSMASSSDQVSASPKAFTVEEKVAKIEQYVSLIDSLTKRLAELPSPSRNEKGQAYGPTHQVRRDLFVMMYGVIRKMAAERAALAAMQHEQQVAEQRDKTAANVEQLAGMLAKQALSRTIVMVGQDGKEVRLSPEFVDQFREEAMDI